jgi:hypothetical protein
MSEEPQSKGWWQTVPGILTATAAIITAVTGLIVALHQTGLFDRERHEIPQSQNEAVKPPEVTASLAGPPPSTSKPPPINRAAPYPVNLSAGTEAKVGDFTYKILAARLDRYGPNKLSLRFQVRMTNNGRYPANFWGASFRLVVAGVPLAPDNDLNEIVDGHSAKEGVVEFVIPDTTADAGFQIGEAGEGAPVVPFVLKAAKPQTHSP